MPYVGGIWRRADRLFILASYLGFSLYPVLTVSLLGHGGVLALLSTVLGLFSAGAGLGFFLWNWRREDRLLSDLLAHALEMERLVDTAAAAAAAAGGPGAAGDGEASRKAAKATPRERMSPAVLISAGATVGAAMVGGVFGLINTLADRASDEPDCVTYVHELAALDTQYSGPELARILRSANLDAYERQCGPAREILGVS